MVGEGLAGPYVLRGRVGALVAGSRQPSYLHHDLAVDAVAFVWADLDGVEDCPVEQLLGVIGAGSVELACSGEEAQDNVESGFKPVGVSAKVIEPLLR